MNSLQLAAEALVEQWGAERGTEPTPAERDLSGFILRELADPRSDHDGLLEDLTQRRWTVGTVAS